MQWQDLHPISTCLSQFVTSYLAVSAKKKSVENSSKQDLFSFCCTLNLFAVTATLIACVYVCVCACVYACVTHRITLHL